ncbi:Hypothetical predicted protein [Paramuricea clavata]|uniref:Uncharacterized protein n=1 Tax=Paramuricea clavata TaxID=317549 RepID=A0A6S7GCI5_PARCT|nr:Hypothetical predicted protein [Paramuricea clavata]
MATAHVFSALILLISASLLTKTITAYMSDDSTKIGIPPVCKTFSSDARCDKLTIAVVSA